MDCCVELWPVSPSPGASAYSLSVPPGPRLRAASRSSARPAARSACSSSGCLSNGLRSAPCDAGKRQQGRSVFKSSVTSGREGRSVGWSHLPMIFQVSDLLPQLFEASQCLGLPQLHCNQLLLQTGHISVIGQRWVPLRKQDYRLVMTAETPPLRTFPFFSV